MISFTTTSDVIQRMRGARRIELSAYVLHSKRMARALESAACNGSRVSVQLEAKPYADLDGQLAQLNRQTVAEMRSAGVDARLVDRSARKPDHMKAALIDGIAFLDDRNWPLDQRNTVVVDDDKRDVRAVRSALHGRSAIGHALAVSKGAALSQEAAVLFGSQSCAREVSVETESFTAGTAPYAAIKALAHAGDKVRLLISADHLKKTALIAAHALQREGVEVRVTRAAEKFAVSGQRAWIGSANATHGPADQLEWGLRLSGSTLCSRLQHRFDSTWRRAQLLIA